MKAAPMSEAAARDTRLRPLEALRAVGRLLRNPDDTRQVFVAIAALRGRSSQRVFERFARTAVGAQVIAERRRLLPYLADQSALARLPEGSVGRAYLAFMQEEKLTADGLVEASDASQWQGLNASQRLVRERMRDMHDLTHIITGYGRDGLGELCLLAFMYRQTGNLGGALIALMGMLKFPRGPVGRRARKAMVEAFRNGGRAGWLPGLDWEGLLAQDLDAVRARFRIADPGAYLAARR
jgi:ubiquinone biosynthesis protein COQ4